MPIDLSLAEGRTVRPLVALRGDSREAYTQGGKAVSVDLLTRRRYLLDHAFK